MKTNVMIIAFLLAMAAVLPASSSPKLFQQQGVPSIVINEVAWSGTAASPTDEWIELKNNTSSDIDLTGWTVSWGDPDDRKIIHFVLGQAKSNTTEVKSHVLPARGLLLLERSDDNTVKDVIADVIFTGALRNEGETLELRNANGDLIDTVNQNGGAWPAGTTNSGNVPYSSMERINPLTKDDDSNWASNNGTVRNGRDADGNLINGTPRAENSQKK